MYQSLVKNGLLPSLILSSVILLGSLFVGIFEGQLIVLGSKTLILPWLWAEVLLFNGVILLLSFGLNKFLVVEKVIAVHNYSPMLLSVVILSSIQYSPHAWKVLVIVALLLFILNRIMRLFNQQEGALGTFEIGVLCGVLYLLEPGLFYILIGAFIAVMQSKSVGWRDISASVVGFAFPILLFLSYCFGQDLPLEIPLPGFELNDGFTVLVPGNVFSWGAYVLILIMLVAYNHFRLVSDQMNIKQRVHYKSWVYGAILFLLGTFLTKTSVDSIQILTISFVFLLPSLQLYLSSLKRAFWKNLLFLICIFGSAVLRLG